VRDIVKIDVRKLMDETCHVLTPDDLDLLGRLDRLADAIIDSDRTDDADILGMPTVIAGRAFYQTTIAHSIFWRARVEPACDGDDLATASAMLWLMACPRVTDDMLAMNPSAIRAASWAFVQAWRASPENQARVVALYAQAEQDDTSKTARGYGDVVAYLCRTFGREPEYWIHQPAGAIQARLEAVARAANDAAKKAPAVARGARVQAPTPTAHYRATAAYGAHLRAIREQWKTEARSDG